MKATLSRIEPFHPTIKPPRGAVPLTVTADHKQVFRETLQRSASEPRLDPVTGEVMWRKNPISGEPLIPLRQVVLFSQERTFTLESEGNGNVRREYYTPPTPEQLAKEKRRLAVQAMQGRIAEALVDGDVDPADLVAALKGRDVPVGPMPPEAEQADVRFPQLSSPGRWKLSNGAIVKGTKVAAEEAEGLVRQARAEAAETPEV